MRNLNSYVRAHLLSFMSTILHYSLTMRHRSLKSQAVRTLEYGPLNQPITAHVVVYFERDNYHIVCEPS